MSTAGAPDIRPTAGAGLIGVYISVAMYGWTLFQMAHYYQRSWRTDTLWLKVYVFYIWAVETLHTYLICAYIWRSAIAEFGNPLAWAVTTRVDDIVTGITGLIMLSIHLFYIRRLWILSEKNILLVGIVTLLAFAHFALEIAVVVLTIEFPSFDQFHKTTPFYTGSLAIAAADDIIIAASLCYFLYTRRTGIRSTDTLVNRIITYSIMTGAVTSVVDIAILICFVAMPDNLVYLALFDFLPILYVTSLLAMLNAREHLQKISTVSTSGTALSGFALGHLRAAGRGAVDSDGNLHHDPVSSKLVFAYPGTAITTTGLSESMQEDAEDRPRGEV
ncbi:uncharacterized protein TRAVEDRAFT_70473 [Trametes versicolor FP-101664 SS1]|uniref:uncharacterized protein n=1 Tax=Trametes versicolor (strain FP-101664) TaxID=717944 RepID=UPI00046228D8|nr:uncharacterized protein TRAVEDRAFT_70473 [Trametes versicolor FP-101664 SS1]EIW62381.1 hypothetical protein TRAVEDRAFT_70473 [Trametes versicolor FP-101664 SS1]